MSIRLRPAELADAEAIRTIYNHEVKTSIMTFDLVPRTLAEQEDWIRARSGAYVAIVAENEEGEILAFGGLSQYRERQSDAAWVPRHHGEDRGLSSGVDIAAFHVGVRDRRTRTRGGTQVRAMARRHLDGTIAVDTRRCGEPPAAP